MEWNQKRGPDNDGIHSEIRAPIAAWPDTSYRSRESVIIEHVSQGKKSKVP